ncbi:MAG: hypothetical protein HY854_01375 [Burkholderiales bacterium]|nr:hypothetical protein [Burkholderiales bacterium]
MHAALAPVIGARGVAALYRRTLFLATAGHPWLADAVAAAGSEAPGDFSALHAALAGRDAPGAAAAQRGLLQALRGLLDRLIGPALTGRLLHTVWIPPPSPGDAVQDASK